jgi:hypothetical protein
MVCRPETIFSTKEANMEAYENLKALVLGVEADLIKAKAGNKAAGTRVRKEMQAIKKAAQEVRQAILELRTE